MPKLVRVIYGKKEVEVNSVDKLCEIKGCRRKGRYLFEEILYGNKKASIWSTKSKVIIICKEHLKLRITYNRDRECPNCGLIT